MDNVIAFEPESMDDMVTVSSELIEQAELAMKLEQLVSQIKAMTYSPFLTDAMKLKEIKREIQNAGF